MMQNIKSTYLKLKDIIEKDFENIYSTDNIGYDFKS